MNGIATVPTPVNEPVLTYASGSPERADLKAQLTAQSERVVNIPLIIGGEEICTGETSDVVMPHAHGHVLARAHHAGPEHVKRAVEAAAEARHDWAGAHWEDRAAVFLKAAELLAGPWRQKLNAATMLGQSKSAQEAEIDSACETIDFFRFNAQFAEQIYEMQPFSDDGVWNQAEYRALEGFVYAITPFNFTAIGANLSSTPALMGNTIIWKPARSSALSSYYVVKLFEAAGMPPGVVNFISGDAVAITHDLLSHPDFAGIHFTGSTAVFKSFWKTIGDSMETYRSYPRIVGETGGKDFIVVHPSADPEEVTAGIIRGAFGYQGQKCSAASRVYVAASTWEELRGPLVEQTESLAMGDPRDFRNFMAAVIDQKAFDKIKGYIDGVRSSRDAEIIAGGECDDSEGWFVQPTIVQARRPDYVTMCEEIFGPVVSVYVYDDGDWADMLRTVDRTSPYALTGAVFARDRRAIREALDALRDSAGNFYVNDKPTGAVVGQQPFGGARGSGTNDKAGSFMNLLRWVSARSIKETFLPPRSYPYPHMDGK